MSRGNKVRFLAHSGHENRVGKCPFWSAKQTSLAEGRPTLAHEPQITAKMPKRNPSVRRMRRGCCLKSVSTNLSRHVARGTNLPFGKPSRDIGCRRSLIAGNARKKAASSRRRTLIMSRLMEISGRGLWIMRTRKACAPGTTTPRDDLSKWDSLTSASYCAASDAVCIAQR
jgi:hypothetical protein